MEKTPDQIAADLKPYEALCLKTISFRATVPERLLDLGLVWLDTFRVDGEFHPVWKATELGLKVEEAHQAVLRHTADAAIKAGNDYMSDFGPIPIELESADMIELRKRIARIDKIAKY